MATCSKLDKFCYVCGHFVPKLDNKNAKTNLTPEFEKIYLQYYYDQPDLFNFTWTPNVVCRRCYAYALQWAKNERKEMPYGTPMIWLEDPNGHHEERCYGCINFQQGLNRAKAINMKYIAGPNAFLPEEHSNENPPPQPPINFSDATEKSDETHTTELTDPFDPPYQPDDESPHVRQSLVSQTEMDYVVARMILSQNNAEFLTGFLKHKKLTQQEVNSTAYCHRQAEYQRFFSVNEANTLTYCNNIKGLINKMGMEYIARDRRLFIDGSVTSLKAVLLHISNKKPSIVVAFSTNLKESYTTLIAIRDAIRYKEHLWKICCDLKVINILQGLKAGSPRFFCYICTWDTRKKLDHYSHKWPKRPPGKHPHFIPFIFSFY